MMQAECRGLEKMREHDPLGQTRMESRSSRFGVRRAALLKVRFEPTPVDLALYFERRRRAW